MKAEELKRCAEDFVYFCNNYLLLDKTTQFQLYEYQSRIVSEWESHRFCIGSKFRGGGFTVLGLAYCLWRCLFFTNEQVIFIVYGKYELDRCGNLLRFMINQLPIWLSGDVKKMVNIDEKEFSDTNSQFLIHSSSQLGYKAQNYSLVFIDEAARVVDLKNLVPYMTANSVCRGKMIIQSTILNYDDYFMDKLIKARIGLIDWHEVCCDYRECPVYDADWEREQRSSLGAEFAYYYEQIAKEREEEIPNNVPQKVVKKSIWKKLDLETT